jgi:hypothetical protein
MACQAPAKHPVGGIAAQAFFKNVRLRRIEAKAIRAMLYHGLQSFSASR